MSAKELNLTDINNESNNEDKGRKTTEAILIKHKNCQTYMNLKLFKEIEQ